MDRLVVAFDLDGTLLRGGWDGMWRDRKTRFAAHQLDRWLDRHWWAMIPMVVTGDEYQKAKKKLRKWGYRKAKLSLATLDGQQVWNDGGKQLFRWNDKLQNRWHQRKMRDLVDEIVTQVKTGARTIDGVADVAPFEHQALHRVGLYASRGHYFLPLREVARRLVVEPLERAGVEVVEVVGDKPPPEGYRPKGKLAAKVIPYQHSDGRLSFSVVPWQGGKAGIVDKLGVDVFAGDGPNDLDVLHRFAAEEGEGPIDRQLRFFLAPANSTFEMYRAISGYQQWFRGNDRKTNVYQAGQCGAGGVLEGLEQVFPQFRRTRRQRVVDRLTFCAGPLYTGVVTLFKEPVRRARRRKLRGYRLGK
jgi:hypothetical protein